MGSDWEALYKEHTIKAFTLTFRKHLELIPNPTPLPSTQLCRTQALIHVGKYDRVVHALTLSTDATPFDQTTRVLRLFHPLTKVDLPPFINDFHLEMEVTLNGKRLSLPWLVHCVFLLLALWIWCMNFHEIIFS
jgi:hypothetical protein